jgi:hypothetical protein
MTKRRKVVISSALLTLGLAGVILLRNEWRIYGIILTSLASIPLYYWSLSDVLQRNATLLTLVLPPLFTLGAGLFWFLLPSSVLTMLPILVLHGLGHYAISLTANIFAVSTVRTIALSRAASGVGFVLTLFVSFLLYNAALSLRTSPELSATLVFVSSVPLFLQGLWTSELSFHITKKMALYTLVFSYGVAILSVLLQFWPVSLIVGSLFLTIAVYVLLGLGQSQLEGRLFSRTVKEYLYIGLGVFLAMLLVTNWRG